jgi:hypothetical protein
MKNAPAAKPGKVEGKIQSGMNAEEEPNETDGEKVLYDRI